MLAAVAAVAAGACWGCLCCWCCYRLCGAAAAAVIVTAGPAWCVSFFLLEIRLCRMRVRVLLLSLRSLVFRSCYTLACCCCRRCLVDFNGEYPTFPVVSDIKSTRKTGRVVNREGHLEEKSKNREPDNEAVLSKGKTRLNRLLSAGFDRLPKTG